MYTSMLNVDTGTDKDTYADMDTDKNMGTDQWKIERSEYGMHPTNGGLRLADW